MLLEIMLSHPSARIVIAKSEQKIIMKTRSFFPFVFFELDHLWHFHCAKFSRQKNTSMIYYYKYHLLLETLII